MTLGCLDACITSPNSSFKLFLMIIWSIASTESICIWSRMALSVKALSMGSNVAPEPKVAVKHNVNSPRISHWVPKFVKWDYYTTALFP